MKHQPRRSAISQSTPVVLSSPHSGTHYGAGLLSQMRVSRHQLRLLEDGPIDLLVQSASRIGARVLTAKYPRAFVDLNRAPDEIDRKLVPDWPHDLSVRATARARAGLGVVPTHIGSQAIYRTPLSRAEIGRRCDQAHAPYHQSLQKALQQTWKMFGRAILIDCHSMPEMASAWEGGSVDISLGDRYGKSCGGWLIDVVEQEFRRLGYSVSRNRPYAGGYITERYGNPDTGFHAIQLEVRRPLFMDEFTHYPNANFGRFRDHLQELVGAAAVASCAFV